ncbi:hypothetical protein COY28_03870 [Candidatus Woesearchaeota archaeon CG_4_10_14_0_2_um_filter_57_5]|nr:MAG: hypothetical protein COV94_00720 [Candidatus Woesearchaeota archaeon CG11_big_fil_rev_8_21_14_0_20_57_5]PIZ53078.1 MAG: hypothetical protein COY28_03870 [Candidatus Woesearchaeota archaeon CG_4_10_14_0_2_um_filter_57_5]
MNRNDTHPHLAGSSYEAAEYDYFRDVDLLVESLISHHHPDEHRLFCPMQHLAVIASSPTAPMSMACRNPYLEH